MPPARRIEAYLNARSVPIHVLAHPPTNTLAEAATAAGIELRQMVRAVMLEDRNGLLMAVLPANYLLDFGVLNRLLGRELQPASRERLTSTFPDCEPGSIPPLAEPYGLNAVLDEQVALMDSVCFEPGSREFLMRMDGATFDRLHQRSRHGLFSRPSEALASPSSYAFTLPDGLAGSEGLRKLHPAEDMERRIRAVKSLPPLPDSTRRLLLLRNNPHATIAELADIVSVDPSLAAQVIRYARSAFYGYRGKVDTLEDAITRVLGFDTVLHMALGLTASKALRIPVDGPLGLNAFWRHATYTAALTQALNTLLPPTTRGKPGLAYLTGLLHDFGFLLLGHLFKAEFFLLNKVVAANPKVPVMLIEKRLLGVEHTQLGTWLMESWEMPPEVIVTAREHHNEYYRDEHATYVNLVLLADHLLKGHFFSDAAAADPPPVILTALGLDEHKVREVMERVLSQGGAGLDDMARALAA